MELSDLKIGDQVILTDGYLGHKSIETITRITPKTVIIKWHTGYEVPFKKDTGKAVGGRAGKKIEVATEMELANMEVHRRYITLCERIPVNGINPKDYTLINEVYDFLKFKGIIKQ